MDEPKHLVASKELVSTAVALAIAGLTLTLIYQTFRGAADLQAKKDVLLLAMSLLGTVTGYYFGRTPGELRAQAAEETARKVEQRDVNNRAALRRGMDAVLDVLNGTAAGETRELNPQRAAVSRLKDLRDSLDVR